MEVLLSTVPVYNNGKVPIKLASTDIVLPSKQWVDVPFRIALAHRKNPEITTAWKEAHKRAIDWEGSNRHIAIVTPYNPFDGYGLGGCHTIAGLDGNGFTLHMNNPVTHFKDVLAEKYPKVLEVAARPDVLTLWGIAHLQPKYFGDVWAVNRIGWTMFEARTIPKAWVSYCDLVEMLIVPSSSQIAIFRDSGVNLPIKVIHEGIDFNAYAYVERPIRDTFTIVTWGRLSSRKCPIELVECFWRAFPSQKYPDARLVLKTRDECLGAGKGIPRFNDPRITVIDENWDLKRLVELVHQADCGVFLSHGEGFYQPPVQAMATGLPVIVVDHSGSADFAHSKYNYPIGLDPKNPYSPSPLGQAYGEQDQLEWWEPDYDQVVETLQYVYHHREEAQKKGVRASKWVRQRFSIQSMIDKLASLLRSL